MDLSQECEKLSLSVPAKNRRCDAILVTKYTHLGYLSAQLRLGRFFVRGYGMNKDMHEAIKWLIQTKRRGLGLSTILLLKVFRIKKSLSDVEKNVNLNDIWIEYQNQVALDNSLINES